MLKYTLDEDVLTYYFSMLKKAGNSGNITISDLLSPSVDILDELFEFFMEKLTVIAKKKVEEQFESGYSRYDDAMYSAYCEEENALFAKTTKCALLNMFFKPNDDNREIINYILSHSLADISEAFRFSHRMGQKIFLEYIRYLVMSSMKFITVDDEIKILKDQPWIKKMSTHRGFSTINDMGRTVLEDVFDSLFNSFIDQSTVFKEVDNYFACRKVDSSIKKYGPSLETEDEVKSFKHVQMRLIISDVYLYLKSKSIAGDGDDEFGHVLSLIEEKIEDGDFVLPRKKAERYEIYAIFYHFLKSDFQRESYMNYLRSTDDIKTLSYVNPLYFLD